MGHMPHTKPAYNCTGMMGLVDVHEGKKFSGTFKGQCLSWHMQTKYEIQKKCDEYCANNDEGMMGYDGEGNIYC